jgi:hypothetical protein
MEAGKPKHAKLKRLAAEGRMAINPTTVAQEAGRSRTLIALESSRLQDVRNRILTINRFDDIAEPRTAAEAILRLREQVVTLKRENDALLTQNTKYLLALQEAKKDASKWRNAFQRDEDHAREDAKITSIRPTRPKP